MGASVSQRFKPTNLFGFFYSPAAPVPSQWRKASAGFVLGRAGVQNPGRLEAVAAGASGYIYFDAPLYYVGGPYHLLFFQQNTLGPAIGSMGGGTSYGPAADILTNTSAVVSKLDAVIRRIKSDNSWCTGIFADDSGPDWQGYGSFNSTQRENIYLAWVALATRYRSVADELGLILGCNGGWYGVNAAPNNNHGYPVRGTHGCSLFDWWCTEGPAGHTWAAQGAFWAGVNAGQWRLRDSAGYRGNLYISPSSGETALWSANDPNVGFIAEQAVYDTNPSTAAAWTTPHDIGISFTGATPTVGIAISPTSATLQTGQTQQFTATVSGADELPIWYVNDIRGGNSTVGTITAGGGLYTAPSSVPGTVAVTAKLVGGQSASAPVTIQATTPAPPPSGGTPPTAPAPTPGTYVDGNTFVGATPNAGMAADTNRGCTVFWGQEGTITGMSALIDGLATGGVGTQPFRYAIYSDASGEPDQLLAVTADGSVTAGDNPAWVALSLVTPILVAAGTALHFHIHSGLNVVGRYWFTTSTGVSRAVSDTFVGGSVATFSGASTGDADISIFATYVTRGPSAATWRDGDTGPRSAAQIEGDGPVALRTITAPADGIVLRSWDRYRNVIVDAVNLTAPNLFTAADVHDVGAQNVHIINLAKTKVAFAFTGCTRPSVRGCTIESGGKGITFDACDDAEAIGNDITLTTDATSFAGAVGHGILFYADAADHSGARIIGNRVKGVQTYAHGIYGWGSNSATLAGPVHASDIVVADNVVDTAQGGIWFSKCQRVAVSGNTVRNCADVGIDFEGCLDSTATGNAVSECKLGALAALYNCKRIVFSGNEVTAGGFTVALGGAGHLTETTWLCGYVRDTCEDISFIGNTFVSTAASKLGEINVWKNAETAACKRLTISGNTFRNCAVFAVSQAQQVAIEGNTFFCDFEPAATIIEVDQSDGVVIRANRLSLAADSAKNTRGTSPIQLYQSSAASTLRVTNVLIEDNQILNFPSVGIEVDTYNGTNYTASFIIRNNEVGVIFIRTSAAATRLITGNTAPATPQTANDTPTTW